MAPPALRLRLLPATLAASLAPGGLPPHVVSRLSVASASATSPSLSIARRPFGHLRLTSRLLARAAGLRAALAAATHAGLGSGVFAPRSDIPSPAAPQRPRLRRLFSNPPPPSPHVALRLLRSPGPLLGLAAKSPFVVLSAHSHPLARGYASVPQPAPFAPAEAREQEDPDDDRVYSSDPPMSTPEEHVGKIRITERAAQRLAAINARDKLPNQSLRIVVESGGCHGYQYFMDLTTKYFDDDVAFFHDTSRVVIDQISLDLVQGSQLDFVDELIGSSFKLVDNPNASSGCGCGTSFGVKE